MKRWFSDYACQGANVDHREHSWYRVPLLHLVVQNQTDTSRCPWHFLQESGRHSGNCCTLSNRVLRVSQALVRVSLYRLPLRAEKLLPLSLQQQNAAKATLKDHEQEPPQLDCRMLFGTFHIY